MTCYIHLGLQQMLQYQKDPYWYELDFLLG